MPVTVSYPGVYVEEISSGVRTIVGVATSITAFLGPATKGPIDKAVTVFDLSDYLRRFGPLESGFAMGFAVRDFFLNGGSQAVIVRIYAQAEDVDGTAVLTADNLTLNATSPGGWADNLLALVDHDVSKELAESWGLTEADLFNLTVRNGPTGPQEKFLNLTVVESPRRVDRVLAAESQYLRVADPAALKAQPPATTEHPDPEKSPWEDTPAKVTTKGKESEDLTRASYTGDRDKRTGMYLLEDVDLFNIVCVLSESRGDTVITEVYQDVLGYAVERRAFLVVDPPTDWAHDALVSGPSALVDALGLVGTAARNAALYYPRVVESDPTRGGQIDTFPACGAIAGVMARTDAQRGVWKAPAGIDASLNGTAGLADNLTDRENGVLNQVAVNALRTFPVYGRVLWGGRTMRGADQAADEYKYVPVRRTALFLEESLYRGLKWVVFEPNDEPLWAQIRLNVGAFMHNLFRQQAFQGKTPAEAYFVKCDKETTTQNDINLGIVNIVVGFAPLKPAEFVIVQLQQLAGQIDV
ncbi:MAG TPA: phage tail sheath subtilisin-like domain-containing protein [Mycobacterium sp.]